MSADDRRPPADGGPPGDDLEKLLEERARLEELIQKSFTRTITVMFTDFKGSTAIAEAEGDMASRLLIKKHHDILFPLVRENNGTLVKTMGDGTMSWFEKAQDGVRTAVRFQESLKAFNGSRPGKTPVIVRVGLNTGLGIVEATDIFGDVVNVAARFEALAGPGEICISETSYESLDDRNEFRCRFVRTTEIKGKTGLHKVYRVSWDGEEPAASASPPEAHGARPPEGAGAVPKAGPHPPPGIPRGMSHLLRTAFSPRPAVDPKKKTEMGKIHEEREAAENAREVPSLVVRRGDVRKMTDEAYRVLGDIVVEPGAILVVENARLFFAPGAGIVCEGAIRGRDALFSALEPGRGWTNVAVDPREDRVSLLERCTFRFGKGRAWGPAGADGGRPPRINDACLYGGGLLVRRAAEKALAVTDCVFHRCSAHEGGGIFLFESGIPVAGCTFELCTAGISGGGIFCLEASPAVSRCIFNGCTADKGGGGMACCASHPVVAGCTFENCATPFLFGGGLSCESSSPTVSHGRFIRCRASKGGGGISCDDGSDPRMVQTTFTDCVPDGSRCGAVGSPGLRGRI